MTPAVSLRFSLLCLYRLSPRASRWVSVKGPSWPAHLTTLMETKATRASFLLTPPSSLTLSCWVWNETNSRPIFLFCVSNLSLLQITFFLWHSKSHECEIGSARGLVTKTNKEILMLASNGKHASSCQSQWLSKFFSISSVLCCFPPSGVTWCHWAQPDTTETGLLTDWVQEWWTGGLHLFLCWCLLSG